MPWRFRARDREAEARGPGQPVWPEGGGGLTMRARRRPTRNAWCDGMVASASIRVLMTAMAVAGCAPTLMAVNSARRVDLDGVSVLPPAGQTWYLGPRDRRHVLFVRKPPLPPHTVGALVFAEKIEIGGPVLGPIRNAQDLKEVTERRLQSVGRFATIESSVSFDTSRGAE